MNIGIVVFLAAFAVISFTGMPIALGMLFVGVIYMLATGRNMGVIPNYICEAYWNNYVIIVIPLFVFTANVTNTGKIFDMIFRLSDGIVGKMRGGMAQVNALVSLVFSGMIGSAMTDALGVDIVEIAEMKRQGYDDGFSCAITAASVTIRPIPPSSMTMLLYSPLTGVFVGVPFMGGMLPGIMLALLLGAYCLAVSYRRKYPHGTKYTVPLFLTYTFKAIPAPLAPVILLGGIYGDAVTPTEAGTVIGAYALIVSVLVYGMLNWESLKKILLETARTVGTVSVTASCASVIVHIPTLEYIPTLLGGFIMGITNNRYVFLLTCNIMSLILGMIFDNSTITPVFIPIIYPLV